MTASEKDLIVIADDEPENLTVLESVLVSKGFRVKSAENAMVALEFLKVLLEENDSPGICTVISDFDMPQMDGIQLLNEIKKLDLGPIPFILMSGKIDRSQAQQYVQLGVDGILFKPFSIDTMLFEIEESQLRRMKKELRKQEKDGS